MAEQQVTYGGQPNEISLTIGGDPPKPPTGPITVNPNPGEALDAIQRATGVGPPGVMPSGPVTVNPDPADALDSMALISALAKEMTTFGGDPKDAFEKAAKKVRDQKLGVREGLKPSTDPQRPLIDTIGEAGKRVLDNLTAEYGGKLLSVLQEVSTSPWTKTPAYQMVKDEIDRQAKEAGEKPSILKGLSLAAQRGLISLIANQVSPMGAAFAGIGPEAGVVNAAATAGMEGVNALASVDWSKSGISPAAQKRLEQIANVAVMGAAMLPPTAAKGIVRGLRGSMFEGTGAGFYSRLDRVVDQLPNKAHPNKILSLARASASKDELEARGFTKWLQGKGDTQVTKDEVAQFLNEHPIVMNRTVLTANDGGKKEIERKIKETQKEFDEVGRQLVSSYGGQPITTIDEFNAAIHGDDPRYHAASGAVQAARAIDRGEAGTVGKVLRKPTVTPQAHFESLSPEQQGLAVRYTRLDDQRRQLREELSSTKGQSAQTRPQYKQWTLPGGSKYKEDLLSAGENASAREGEIAEEIDRIIQEEYKPLYQRMDTDPDAREQWQKVVAKIDKLKAEASQLRSDRSFSAPHFSGHGQDLETHALTTERTIPKQGRGLFIDEYQSDRYQQAKTRGFKPGGEERVKLEAQLKEQRAQNEVARTEFNAAKEDIKIRAREIRDQRTAAEREWTSAHPGDDPFSPETSPEVREDFERVVRPFDERLHNLYEGVTAKEARSHETWANARETEIKLSEGIARGPLGEAWPEVMLKQQLLEFANNPRAKWFGWNSGATVTDRYNLGNAVGHVTYDKDGQILKAFDEHGRLMQTHEVPQKSLVEWIGKQPAEALIANGIVKNDELRRMGGNAKAILRFYEEETGNRVTKILKSLGFNATIEPVDLGVMGATHRDQNKVLRRGWIVQIPQEVKKKIREGGLPLMSIAGPAGAMAVPDDPDSHWDEAARVALMAGSIAALGQVMSTEVKQLGTTFNPAKFPGTAKARKVVDITKQRGDYTVNPLTGEVPTEGIMAGRFANQSNSTKKIPLDKFKPSSIEQFYLQHKKEFAKGDAFLGTWVDDGHVYLDVGKRFEPGDRRAATKFAETQRQPAGLERDAQGNWPKAQEAIFDLGAKETHPVGNFHEWSQSEEMQQRLTTLYAKGVEVMSGKDWWNLYGGPLERVYGKERVRPLAGFLAATSPASTPENNLRSASEYLRRLIKEEPIIQSEFRIPADAHGKIVGSFNGPGKQMPMEQARKGNLLRAANGEQLQADKVNDMFHALTGVDVGVYDRRYAYAFDNPTIGAHPEIEADKLRGSMMNGNPSSYASIENAVRTGAKRAGVSLQKFSSYVWEGIGETIKETGGLFGSKINREGAMIPPSSGGFNNIFEEMIKGKAKHLGITIAEMEKRLRSGDAELLSTILATGAGMEAYRRWQLADDAGREGK